MIIHIVPIVLLDFLLKNVSHVVNRLLVRVEKQRSQTKFLYHSIGVGGTRYISFEDRHWHNDCFVCQRCRGSLVGRGFLTEGPDILCPDCGKREQYYPTENNGYGNGQRSIVNDYHKTN
jgi:hypothetical protein